jgi:hypothetical protein
VGWPLFPTVDTCYRIHMYSGRFYIALDVTRHDTAQPLHYEMSKPPCYNLCYPNSTSFDHHGGQSTRRYRWFCWFKFLHWAHNWTERCISSSWKIKLWPIEHDDEGEREEHYIATVDFLRLSRILLPISTLIEARWRTRSSSIAEYVYEKGCILTLGTTLSSIHAKRLRQ